MPPTTPEPTTGNPRRTRRGSSPRQNPNETCAVCRKSITFPMFVRHVNAHGFSINVYRRTFSRAQGAPPAPGGISATGAASAAAVASALLGSSEFLAPLADEVAHLLATGPQRKQLLLALSSLIATRLDAHGRAVAAFEKVRAELTEPHRIERGEDGTGQASTKDLVAVGALLRAEVQQGEDLLLKVAKLTVEEGKNKTAQQEASAGHTLSRFTGDAEAIPIPAALSAGERETVRALLGVLARPTRATTLDAVALTSSRPIEVPAADPCTQTDVVGLPPTEGEGEGVGLPPDPVPPRPTRRSHDEMLGF